MDLDRELHDMLRERSDEVRSSSSIPPATLRKARIQRAMVGLGTGTLILALAFTGFLVSTGIDSAPEVSDAPVSQVIASESRDGESWELSVSVNEDEICARLEVVRSGNADGEVDEICAPEDEVLDARLTEVWDIPLAWGSVSSQVSEVSTNRWGRSTLIGVDPPEFFDVPDEFGSERRLFLAFDPNGIDAVAARDSGGKTLDTVAVDSHKPAKIASGRIEDLRWSLTARPTIDGVCMTFELTTERKRSSSGYTDNLCGLSGTDLSLTQISMKGLDPVLVFGTVPEEATQATLQLEGGEARALRLRLPGGLLAAESYYVAIVDDVTTEGAVASFDRGGRELERRELCAPDSPQMLDRGTINVPLFCGDAVD